jgi:hypothetical protein
MAVKGPGDKEGETKTYLVSRASAARWRFGRKGRQRIYEPAREALHAAGRGGAAERFAFCDDFQELVGEPRPLIPRADRRLEPLPASSPDAAGSGAPRADRRLGPLPAAVEGKIAVLVADGDKFGKMIGMLKEACGAVEGQRAFTLGVEAAMTKIVSGLVLDLEAMLSLDEQSWRAAAIPREESYRHRKERRHLQGYNPLLRFETLLYGGDDLTFVVPAWLGWWLARRFFALVEGCEIAYQPRNGGDKKSVPLQFSAGLVFAPAKSPIRALKGLALELCHLAKERGGGLEIEALESLEPPSGGVAGLRTRLFGPQWRDSGGSRMTTLRDEVGMTFEALASAWVAACAPEKKPLSASLLHRALRAARRVEPFASPLASAATVAVLKEYAGRVGGGAGFSLSSVEALPYAGGGFESLRLHFLLQQRDYVVAGHPFVHEQAAP